jgi:hypothetical protein
LLDKDTIIAYPDLSKVATGTKCSYHPCHCNHPHKITVLPHFVNRDFVGAITAREVIRALYDAFYSKDGYLTIRLPEHIKSVVAKDRFHVGLNPGLYPRSLVLRFKLDRLRRRCLPHIPTNICQHTRADKIYTEKDVLKEWLKALLYIKCKANFELCIVLFQRNVRMAVIDEVLETIAGVRQTLQSRHAKVKIDWTYRGNWSKGKNCSP